MDRIVIEVEDSLARKWRYASPKVKQEVSKEVDHFLNTIFKKNEEDLWPFLEELRSEAETRGFSDQELNQILNEE